MRYFILRNCIIELPHRALKWDARIYSNLNGNNLKGVDRIRSTPILAFPHQGGRNNIEGAAYVDE